MAAEQSKNKNGAKKRKISDEFQEEAIFQAPEIIREPSSRQARLGSNVVLRITATGKPLPSYQWYHNGKKISGANTDRLTLNKVRRASAGAYHCEAKNHAGKAVSRQCMLSFFTQKVPKLVLDSRMLEVEVGKPIALKVLTPDPASFKDFRIFWVFNGMRIKGAYGLELSIASGKKKYEGEYKAMISVGSGIETSNICKVTIVPTKAATPSEPAPEPPPPASEWEDYLFNPEDEEPASDEPVIESIKEEEPKAEENVNMIVDWNEISLSEKPRKNAASPKLVKKREFLENFLARWQRNMGKFGKDAA